MPLAVELLTWPGLYKRDLVLGGPLPMQHTLLPLTTSLIQHSSTKITTLHNLGKFLYQWKIIVSKSDTTDPSNNMRTTLTSIYDMDTVKCIGVMVTFTSRYC